MKYVCVSDVQTHSTEDGATDVEVKQQKDSSDSPKNSAVGGFTVLSGFTNKKTPKVFLITEELHFPPV